MGIKFDGAAFKHGFTEADAESAISHHLRMAAPFEESARPGDPQVWAWVGPAVGGRTIEVFAAVPRFAAATIFHMMDARQTTLDRLDELE